MSRAVVVSLFLLLPLVGWADPVSDALYAGDVERAVRVAAQQVATEPEDLVAHEQLVDMYLALGVPARALRVAKDRQEYRDDADARYLIGRAVLTATDARTAYLAALELEPDHARSHMGLAAVYRSEGSALAAEESYRRALDLDPSLGEAWAGLQASLLLQGRPADALVEARRAMAAVPHEAEPWLAVALLAPAEAEAVLREAVGRAAGDPRVHEALAEHLLARGEWAEARLHARQALAIDPTLADARLTLAVAASLEAGTLDATGYGRLLTAQDLERSDPSGAREAYDALVTDYPGSPLPWMARARVRAATDPSGAGDDLVRALEIDPDQVEAQAALGMLLHRTGSSAQAWPLLRAATAARPHDASLAVVAGQAAVAAGQPAEGRARLEEAARAHPWDARAALALAGLYAEQGEVEAAYHLLKGAVERVPDAGLVLALAAAARELGRVDEAADLLDILAGDLGDPSLAETAARLREAAP